MDTDMIPLLQRRPYREKRTTLYYTDGRPSKITIIPEPQENLKWYEHIKRRLTPQSPEEIIKAKEKLLGGEEKDDEKKVKLRYHCSPLYDGQVLMFWVKMVPGDSDVAASWTCDHIPEDLLTRNPFARNGSLIPFKKAFNPNKWGGFDAPLTTSAIEDAKRIAVPILKAYNEYQQDLARKEAAEQAKNGRSRPTIACSQYRMIGIPLIVRQRIGTPTLWETQRAAIFEHHNLKTVPRVDSTKFVRKLLDDINRGANGKASSVTKMKRFYSLDNPSKSLGAMQGAGYLQESHIVLVERTSVAIRIGLSYSDRPRHPVKSEPPYREGQLVWCRVVVRDDGSRKGRLVWAGADLISSIENGSSGVTKREVELGRCARENIEKLLQHALQWYNEYDAMRPGHTSRFTEIETSLKIERCRGSGQGVPKVHELVAGPSLEWFVKHRNGPPMPQKALEQQVMKTFRPLTVQESAQRVNYATGRAIVYVIRRAANSTNTRIPASTGIRRA